MNAIDKRLVEDVLDVLVQHDTARKTAGEYQGEGCPISRLVDSLRGNHTSGRAYSLASRRRWRLGGGPVEIEATFERLGFRVVRAGRVTAVAL